MSKLSVTKRAVTDNTIKIAWMDIVPGHAIVSSFWGIESHISMYHELLFSKEHDIRPVRGALGGVHVPIDKLDKGSICPTFMRLNIADIENADQLRSIIQMSML